MQKTFVPVADQSEPQILVRSTGGDYSRRSRVLFTVVGEGTLWVDNKSNVTQETGVPFVAGVYGSDEGLWANETLYAVAGDGEEIDARIMLQGGPATFDDSADDNDPPQA